jgi:hypothetical protein
MHAAEQSVSGCVTERYPKTWVLAVSPSELVARTTTGVPVGILSFGPPIHFSPNTNESGTVGPPAISRDAAVTVPPAGAEITYSIHHSFAKLVCSHVGFHEHAPASVDVPESVDEPESVEIPPSATEQSVSGWVSDRYGNG